MRKANHIARKHLRRTCEARRATVFQPRIAAFGERRIAEHPILKFKRGRKVKFYFEGKEMIGYEGEPIACALIANGIKAFRITRQLKRPRGFFCAVGKCSSCLMKVSGKANVMVCVERLKEGIRVERMT